MRRFVILAALCVAPAGVLAQQFDFDDPRWVIRGDGAKVEEYLGKKALRLRTGSASLPEIQFENGTIEFDVATSGHRSFVGVGFRMEPGGNYEHIYLRPHNGGNWDAMQYTPICNGMTAWQLYSGEGFSGMVPIPRDRWIHVRVEVDGSRAEVTIDGAGKPSLVVTDLKRRGSRGGVGIDSFFPAGEPEDLYPTSFADVVIRSRAARVPYRDDGPPPAETGFMSAWRVSPPFVAPEQPIRSLKREWLEDVGWSLARGDASGIVNIATVAGRPEGASLVTVLARTTIKSKRARRVRMNFGFSDRVSIFLNGELLYTGDNTYRSRNPRYLGIMTVDHEALYLPLRKGDNGLVFAVSEAFGGWGLIARLEERDGLEVRP